MSVTEDFTSGAGNFSVVDGTWGVVNQTYQVTTASQASSTHLNNRSVHNTSITGDFVLTADASTVGTGSAWNDFAIVFGYQDANNYYFFSSNESNDGNTSGLFKVVGGVVTELADITTPITSDTTYQAKIERIGSTINVYRNNTLLASESDSTFTSGKIGFGSKGDQVTFDNLVVTTIPATPTSLSASAISSSQINLSWTDNANDETGYTVQRASDSGFTTGLVTTNIAANSTSFSATGLTASTTYYFRVHATNSAGSSAYSSVASAATQSSSIINESFTSGAGNFTVVDGTWGVVNQTYQITTPSQASTAHLNNRSVHNTSVTGDFVLTADASTVGTGSAWNDLAIIFGYQDADNFYFFSSNESNDGNTSGLFKVVSGVVTELADITTPITSDTTYQAKVERIGSTINVYRNNTLLASASDATFTSGKVGFGSRGDVAIFDNLVVSGQADVTAPAAPSSLAATAISSSQVNLSWTDNASDETGFTIDRATDSSFTTGLVTSTVGANTTSVEATGLSASTTYYFRVRATNSAGSSANSNTASAATPAAQTAKPGPSNTGPTNPSILQPSGSFTVSTEGAVIENIDVTGVITIAANNVTIRNFRINAGGAYFAFRINAGVTGTVFEDGEATNFASGFCASPQNYTARRLNVHHVGRDAFQAEGNVLIESCWMHHLGMAEDAHADGVQSSKGSNIIIRNNFFDMPIYENANGFRSNSAVIIKSDIGPIDNVLIEGNWMNGGNYTIYSRTGSFGAPTNVRILNNRFGRDYRYGLYSFNGTVEVSGNVWDDTGLPANENP